VDTGGTKLGDPYYLGPAPVWFAFWFQAPKARAIDRSPLGTRTNTNIVCLEDSYGLSMWQKWRLPLFIWGARKGFFCPPNGEFLVKGLGGGRKEWMNRRCLGVGSQAAATCEIMGWNYRGLGVSWHDMRLSILLLNPIVGFFVFF